MSHDIGEVISGMRQEYWLGLCEEEDSVRDLMECLVFTLGGQRYALETRFAAQVIRVPRLVRVPATQQPLVGIFNLRGSILAAIDIRPLLGLPQPELTQAARVLVVKGPDFETGILAEEALGVQGLPVDQFEQASESGGGSQGFIRGNFLLDEGLVVLLDSAALLASPSILIGQR